MSSKDQAAAPRWRPVRPTTVRFEQAVYGSFAFRDDGYAMLAQSPGCRAEWLAEFRAACQKFGERPAGTGDFPGLFALKLPSGVWAVVGVSPQGRDDRGRPGALAFHGLFLTPREYRKAGNGPFRLAPAIRAEWPGPVDALPKGVLKLVQDPETPGHPDSRASAVATALAKGGRVAIEADRPADKLAGDVWAGLPLHVREGLSVATWTFGNANAFHLCAVPKLAGLAPDPSYVDPFAPEPVAPAPPEVPPAPVRRSKWAAILVFATLTLGAGGVALALRGAGGEEPPVPPKPVVNRVSVSPKSPPPAPVPTPEAWPWSPGDDDPAERKRVAEVLEDFADRCELAAVDVPADSVALMNRISVGLRYKGPWLSDTERRGLGHGSAARRALDGEKNLRRFLADRPLPGDFAAYPLRRQLATLAWSFHIDPETLCASSAGPPEPPRRSPSEFAQAFAAALATDGPMRPGPLADRLPALAAYAAFLDRLPRR